MPTAEKVTVTTNGVKLLSAAGDASYQQSAVIKVPTGGTTIYVGDSDVDTTNGFPVAAGESLSVDLVGSEVYAVVTTGTQAVNVFRRL